MSEVFTNRVLLNKQTSRGHLYLLKQYHEQLVDVSRRLKRVGRMSIFTSKSSFGRAAAEHVHSHALVQAHVCCLHLLYPHHQFETSLPAKHSEESESV